MERWFQINKGNGDGECSQDKWKELRQKEMSHSITSEGL